MDFVVVAAVAPLEWLLFGLVQPEGTFPDKVEVADDSIVTSIFPLLKSTIKFNLSTLLHKNIYLRCYIKKFLSTLLQFFFT